MLMVSIQTPVGQLFKIPVLIEHFLKHQQQNGVSLIGFLQDHYRSDHKDADLPEDEQLPFKQITFNALGYAIVPSVIKTNEVISLPADRVVTFPQIYTPQQHLGSIFHPPRV
jgi:hypothetical protein